MTLEFTGYAGEDALNDNNSPSVVSQGCSTSISDYVSASIRVASSLPSAEQMRVVRMFIKHSHYFANACQQGSIYLPASMKVDIFSSKVEIVKGELKNTNLYLVANEFLSIFFV